MNPAPGVSIVLPVRDAGHTLDECLASIAKQSYTDYELIAVDDGSTDDSADRLQHWAERDPRIRLISQPPLGLVTALNRGLREARAPLVARMDGDDLMHPQRLSLQVQYLAAHPHIDVLASQVSLFPKAELRGGYRHYIRWQNACVSPRDIAEELFVESPFVHPSVMYRRAVVSAVSGYRDGPFPEDYDLWLRLAQAGIGMAKLPQVLLAWREGPQRLSRVDPRCSRQAFDRLRAAYLGQRLRRDVNLKNRPLVMWGAGRKTRQRCELLLRQGFKLQAWVDIDPRKIGNRLKGVPVVGPEWLARSKAAGPRPLVLSYVTNHGAREDIAGNLQTMGYQRGCDYFMVG